MKEPSAFQNTALYFADAAEEYLNFLKKEHPEHFMESVAQATQRKITVASLDLVAAERSDVYVYSELLIQWRDAKNELRRVVPDNMVVVADKRPKVSGNFAIPIQPARPFVVFEYVSKTTSRKDYQQSYDKYEIELKVPYYFLFYPDAQEVTLFKYNRRKGKYASVHPDDAGHYAIPELDLTIALHDGWARYWWRGRLMPIPTELQAELHQVQKENAALRRENADKAKILANQTRALDDQARQLNDKDRLIADMQEELERLRKSAG
jgi:Uma2 family endonuclease